MRGRARGTLLLQFWSAGVTRVKTRRARITPHSEVETGGSLLERTHGAAWHGITAVRTFLAVGKSTTYLNNIPLQTTATPT